MHFEFEGSLDLLHLDDIMKLETKYLFIAQFKNILKHV